MPHDPTGRKPDPLADYPFLRRARDESRIMKGVSEGREGREEETTKRGPGDDGLSALRVCLELRPSLRDYVAELVRVSDRLVASEEWQERTFALTRWLRAHPDLTAVGAEEAWAAVSPLVSARQWRECFGVSAADAEADLLHWWDRLLCLPTVGPLEYAARRSAARLLKLPGRKSRQPRASAYRRFVSLAAYLQQSFGDRPVFFHCERIADLFGLAHRQIYRFCDYLTDDGLAELVEPGTRTRRARYRIDLSKFPELNQE